MPRKTLCHTFITPFDMTLTSTNALYINEPWHEISNNVVCATSKGSDQPAHTRRLTRAFASHLNILWLLSYWQNIIWSFKLKRKLHWLVWVYTCQNATLLETTSRHIYAAMWLLHLLKFNLPFSLFSSHTVGAKLELLGPIHIRPDPQNWPTGGPCTDPGGPGSTTPGKSKSYRVP